MGLDGGNMNRQDAFARLAAAVSDTPEVLAIGQSGIGELPVADECDVDVFVFCDRVPSEAQRAEALAPLGVEMERARIGAIHSAHWGEGDCLTLTGMEVWLMYFDAEAQREYALAVLEGAHLDKVDNYFYPTGRLATLAGMKPLLDRNGWLASTKAFVARYPESLAEALTAHHLHTLHDTEDLERAAKRGDALFYHFALDLALDHFLQALFALNRTYFPSRKRSLQIVAGFLKKPECLNERLHTVLRLGVCPDTLSQSFDEWMALVRDLEGLKR
jgi:hypothetical protein